MGARLTQSLIDEIINAVNTIIYRALEAIENGLFSIPPPTLGFGNATADRDADGRNADVQGEGGGKGRDFKEEIENGVHRLETLLEATVDKTFDRFEIFTLRNILTVPDDLAGWMRLTHYEVCGFFIFYFCFILGEGRSSGEGVIKAILEEWFQLFFYILFSESLTRSFILSQNLTLPTPASAPTPESILHLRRKVQATKSLNLALRSQHARNAALLTSLRSLLNPPSSSPSTFSSTHPSLSFLAQNPSFISSSSTSSEQQQPLTQQATSAIAHLPALRTLLADLRPRLETLRAAAIKGEQDSGDGDRDRHSTREERRLYIESRVRKVVAGDGEGEGGVGEGLGGGGLRVAESEIKGLENVMRGLQGGEGEGGAN